MQEMGLEYGGDFSLWETDNELLSIDGVEITGAREDGRLTNAKLTLDVATNADGARVHVDVSTWFSISDGRASLISAEALARR